MANPTITFTLVVEAEARDGWSVEARHEGTYLISPSGEVLFEPESVIGELANSGEHWIVKVSPQGARNPSDLTLLPEVH